MLCLWFATVEVTMIDLQLIPLLTHILQLVFPFTHVLEGFQLNTHVL